MNPKPAKRTAPTAVLWGLLAALLFSFCSYTGIASRQRLHMLCNTLGVASMKISARNLDVYRTDLVELRTDDEPRLAEITLAASHTALTRVLEQFDLELKQRVLVLCYASSEELTKHLGAFASHDALGAYWKGAVMVVSPSATPSGGLAHYGLLVHELTHLVLDYSTRGNYPRWFSEALAQYNEYLASGYALPQPASADLYEFGEFSERFGSLDDTAVAYSQAFLLVSHMAEQYGWDSMIRLVHLLGTGVRFEKGVEQVYGKSIESLDDAWRRAIEGTGVLVGE